MAIGARQGGMLDLFLAAGQDVLTMPSGRAPLPWLALSGGVVVHLVAMALPGVVFSALRAWVGLHLRWLPAAGAALISGSAAHWLTPWFLGVLGPATQSVWQLAFATLSVAFALVIVTQFDRRVTELSRTSAAEHPLQS